MHPPAALLHTDRAPLVLHRRKGKNPPTKTQRSDNQSDRTSTQSAGMSVKLQASYLGEEAVLGEELGDLGREDDVPGRKKGIRLGFCQHRRRKRWGKGEDHDGEGFASTCTRRCRRSTSRSTGSDPCPPTLLDQLPYRRIPKFLAESPDQLPNRAATRAKPRFTEEHFAYKTRNQRIWGVGRRRAYLGADEGRHESQRGERVGGDGGWGWMGTYLN